MGTLFEQYKDALQSSDEEIGALILDRAAEDFSLSLGEFLDLIKIYECVHADS